MTCRQPLPWVSWSLLTFRLTTEILIGCCFNLWSLFLVVALSYCILGKLLRFLHCSKIVSLRSNLSLFSSLSPPRPSFFSFFYFFWVGGVSEWPEICDLSPSPSRVLGSQVCADTLALGSLWRGIDMETLNPVCSFWVEVYKVCSQLLRKTNNEPTYLISTSSSVGYPGWV